MEAVWPCGLPARMGDSEPLWKPCGRAGCPPGWPPAWATQSLCGSRSEPLWKPCGRAGCPPAWATQSLCGSRVAVQAACPHGRLRAFVEAVWPCGLPARMGDSEPLWKPCGRAGCPPAWATQSLCGSLAGCPPAWAVRAARPHSLCGSLVAVRAARPHGRLRAFVEAVWPCGLPARMGDSEPLWKPCGRAGCLPAWATQSLCGSRVAVRAATQSLNREFDSNSPAGLRSPLWWRFSLLGYGA